jgi:hypothetical protein
MSLLYTTTVPTLFAALAAVTLAAHAEAFTLTYSAFASDASADVSVLDATLSISVASAAGATGDDLLILDLANQTAAPDAYTVAEVYLNYTGGADTSAFTLVTDPLGNGALTDGTKIVGNGKKAIPHEPHAGGFGYYDLLLDLSTPPGANDGLAAGDSATWEIDLGGTGFDALDFGPLSTTRSPNQVAGAAALKFTQGPHGDSAYVLPGFSDDARVRPNSVAAVIPEPSAMVLVTSAVVGLACHRRRARA